MLSLLYWFNSRPEPISGNPKKILFAIIALLILGGIILATGSASKLIAASKKIQYLFAWFFFSNAFIGLALVFFNYELTPFLRSYFWYPLWFISAAVWVICLFRIHLKNKKRAVQHSGREEEIKKYLPS